jgi:cytochrome c
MRKVVFVMVLVMAMIFSVAMASHASTLEDAKAMAIKAASFVKANGPEKGLAEIGNVKGQFVKGDLYVTCQDINGVVRANPMAPTLVGQNHTELKDPNGKFFVKEMIEAAKKGGDWVSYVWTNPATKKVQPKKAWVQRVEGTELYTLCGIFQ